VTVEKGQRIVHIVSHGPHCLDGLAAAVAVARARPEASVEPHFVNYPKVDEAIWTLKCEPPYDRNEVWITDVSWTDPAADRALRALAQRGVQIYWFDHHRTAIERYEAGEINVPFAGKVLTERFAAARLTYDYLRLRLSARGELPLPFADFWPVVEMADDNDRWIHAIPGSHDLALTIRALGSELAYTELLSIDGAVTYSARMRQARVRVESELRSSFEIAERSRLERALPSGINLVTAVCDGYPSEIADSWGKSTRNAVFALLDATSLGVSLRRSADCDVDLSELARVFGGGGHPAAAGCELPELRRRVAQGLAEIIGAALCDRSGWSRG